MFVESKRTYYVHTHYHLSGILHYSLPPPQSLRLHNNIAFLNTKTV